MLSFSERLVTISELQKNHNLTSACLFACDSNCIMDTSHAMTSHVPTNRMFVQVNTKVNLRKSQNWPSQRNWPVTGPGCSYVMFVLSLK